MARAHDDKVDTLEKGNIYFFYRPRVEEEQPAGTEDVERLYMVLSPEGKRQFRMAVIGRKKLPDPSGKGQRLWGFVDKVAGSPKELGAELEGKEYGTRTRGERHLEPARPAGEGVYRILRHGDHTHLVYALELPRREGEVQESFNIEREASYILSFKNPETAGSRLGERKAEFPGRLKDAFHGRKFANADPPDFFDYEGAEFLIVSASDDISDELGITLHPERETRHSADVFKELRLEGSRQPTEPLFKGEWR